MDQSSKSLNNRHLAPLILIIDDEDAIIKTLGNLLEDDGFRVVSVSDPRLAIKFVGELIPDVVLMDVFMPGLNGIDLLTLLKKEFPSQSVIMISGYSTISIALEALKAGAADFIEKPFNVDELIKKINKELARNNEIDVAANNVFSNEKQAIFGLVGASALFCELIQQAELVARLSLPILIYGGTGSGKRQLAHFIHYVNLNGGKALAELDCRTEMSEAFFLALLQHDEPLVLLHVDRLPLPLQQELLVVLQKTKKRIIATTTKLLFSMVGKGNFLSQLYKELHAAPLEIPALTKRRYDIPLLVEYFLQRENKLYCKQARMATSAMRALRNYPWVGNVAELELVIKQVVLALPKECTIITLEFLRNFLQQAETTVIEEQSFQQFVSFNEAVTSFEKNFLLYQLKKNRYDLEQVSSKMKLKIPRLQSKLASLNITLKK